MRNTKPGRHSSADLDEKEQIIEHLKDLITEQQEIVDRAVEISKKLGPYQSNLEEEQEKLAKYRKQLEELLDIDAIAPYRTAAQLRQVINSKTTYYSAKSGAKIKVGDLVIVEDNSGHQVRMKLEWTDGKKMTLRPSS